MLSNDMIGMIKCYITPKCFSVYPPWRFGESDFYQAIVSGKLMLKNRAVPTKFNFLSHLMSKVSTRRILQQELEI